MWSCRSSAMILIVKMVPHFIICRPWNYLVAVRLSGMRGMNYVSCFFELQSYKCLHLNGNTCLEEPLDVPECPSSHLTTCDYKGFEGKEEEMELVRQILKAAKVLKSMKITVTSNLGLKLKLLIHEKLGKFQRSSQNCEIAFEEGRFTWCGSFLLDIACHLLC